MIRVGITATRTGMQPAQRHFVLGILLELNPQPGGLFVHGDCVGGDAEGHLIAQGLGYRIHIFPPTKKGMRAFCEGAEKVWPEDDYMVRNHSIVDSVDRMIGCPKSYKEEFRGSGTWAAIRYTLKVQKPLYLVWPDGKITPHNMPPTRV